MRCALYFLLFASIEKLCDGNVPAMANLYHRNKVMDDVIDRTRSSSGSRFVDIVASNVNVAVGHVKGKLDEIASELVETDKAESEKEKKRKKRILILMSDTGGGHRASAQALHRAIDDNFPNTFAVDIMDIWTDHANAPFNKFVPTYRFLAKYPFLWRGFYAYGGWAPTKKFTEVWSWQNSYKAFEEAIVGAEPDVVVSVHPLCQLMPISIVSKMNAKRSNKRRIPFFTVVTDLGGAHSTWFDKRVDACYVPSEAVEQLALKQGIPSEKVKLKGLPIRPSFWTTAKPKSEVRRELGLRQGVKTVLLMGGGDGVGGLNTIALELKAHLEKLKDVRSQIVVVCGHNKQMSQDLTNNLKSNKKVNIVVKGFCENIDEYMTASDCLVTKAGPGTIAESMIRGLPMVLSYYLPGQEYGNIPYAVKGGFGIYTGMRPTNIAKTVGMLFTNDTMLSKMSSVAKDSSHQKATIAIAKDIGDTAIGMFR